MNILLINPPVTHYSKSKRNSTVESGLPIGLLYIAAVLEKEGFAVDILDCLISKEARLGISFRGVRQYGISEDEIKLKIKKAKPDIVGIACQFTSQAHNSVRISEVVKEINPHLPIVIGGPHATALPNTLLNKTNSVDIVVIGEGERTILDVMLYMRGKICLENVKGIAFRDNNRIIVNEPREFIEDLDELPLPAYHLIDMALYFKLQNSILNSRPALENRCLPVITSRGCPFNCVFCSIHLSMGRKWRAHSPEYVLEHIKFLVKNYGVKNIHFEDDNFTFEIKRCERILDLLTENSIDIKWDMPNGIRVDRLSIEVIGKMKRAGCSYIALGIESGDQSILNDVIKKSLKLEAVTDIVKVCKRVGMPVGGFFLIGFPGEKIANMRKTADFALMLMKKYGFMNSRIGVVTPLPGTELSRICKENGYLSAPPTSEAIAITPYGIGKGLIETKDFNMEDLKNIIASYNKKALFITFMNYIRKPQKLLTKIYNEYKKRRK